MTRPAGHRGEVGFTRPSRALRGFARLQTLLVDNVLRQAAREWV